MTSDRPRICVVGSSNIDLTFRTPRLPRPGETIEGRAFQLGFGGKGANQAVMAARLGAQVTMIGKVGQDVFGADYRRHYRAQGIDTTHLSSDTARFSGVASIVVDDEARNCIIVVPGANEGLTPGDVQDAAPAIRASQVLLGQLEVPVETTLEAFRVAKAAGVRTILNPAPAAPLPDELLRLTDLCVPNETEAELLTGQTVASSEQAEAAARSLQSRGPKAVLVTLGARGVLVVEEGAAEHLPAVAVEAVDPTGAGDAFIGSLAVFLAEGNPLTEAARRANGVAALSVTRLGTQTAFPSRPEVEAFLGGTCSNRADD
jgi:ribokinase